MAYPKKFRNQLGITQEAFATLINCSNGQLSMAESGRRELPRHSSGKLSIMEAALQNIQQDQPQPLNLIPMQAHVQKWLNRCMKKWEAKLFSLRLKHDQLQEKMDTLQLLSRFCHALKGNPAFSGDKLPAMQLALLARKAQQQWNELRFKKMKLQVALAALEAEMAKASELMG